VIPHLIVRALVPLVLGAGTLHAQQASASRAAPDSAALPGRIVEVEAGEFFFKAPDSISAGLTTFRMRQIGLVHHRVLAGGAARDSLASDRGDQTRGFHMLWLVRLDSGKTATDFYRAVQAREPTPWARSMGGPAFAMPPRTSNATLVLEPGSYVLTCFVGSAREDRTRHHLLNGMFRALTVLPTREPVANAPVADVVVRISESGSVDYSTPILAGRRVLRVENARARPYEFTIRRVLPGRSTEEALAWRQQDAPTTSFPFVQWGGLSDVPAGGSMITTIDFEPGVYFVGTGRMGRVPFTVLPAR
jgi:hypothetical protein